MTLSLLAAAGIGAISIGSASAMPVSNLAGLSESHVQDVRLVCDRFGRCYNTRRAYRSYPYAQRYYGDGYYSGYGRGYYSGYGPGYGYYADRVSELVSARSASASAFGNPQSSSNDFGPAALKTGGLVRLMASIVSVAFSGLWCVGLDKADIPSCTAHVRSGRYWE